MIIFDSIFRLSYYDFWGGGVGGGGGRLDNFTRNSINVEMEAEDVGCLSPVWNLQAVFESPISPHFSA